MSKFNLAPRPVLMLRPCLAILLSLILSAAAQAADAGRTYLVGFAQDTMANDWRKAQVRALQDAFRAAPNVRFVYTDGKGDTAHQIHDMEAMAHDKVDVLITSPRNGAVATPAISRIYKAGIPVVLITRSITNEDYTTLVAPDDEQIAANAARYMSEQLAGKGRILMLQGVPTATTAKARTSGFLQALKAYPDMRVVAVKPANYLRADAIRAVEQVISEGVGFDAIYAQSDSMATGARMAMRRAGIAPGSKLIVGIDYISEAREAIRRGDQAASFLYPTSAEETARVVMDILAGKPVPKRIVVESRMITRENVEDVEPIF